MKLESIIRSAKESLQKRAVNSKLARAINEDAMEILDNIGSYADPDVVLSLIGRAHSGNKNPITGKDAAMIEAINKLERIALNGADNWRHYSISGCSRCYNWDIKEHYLTPSLAARVVDRFRGMSLIEWQGIWLQKAYARAKVSILNNPDVWKLINQ